MHILTRCVHYVNISFKYVEILRKFQHIFRYRFIYTERDYGILNRWKSLCTLKR